jgi:hypothetical protein
MRGDQVRRPVNRAGDEMRLPVAQRSDHVPGEARSQHERLELQAAVQEPDEPQRDLQLASSDLCARHDEREAAERKRRAEPQLGGFDRAHLDVLSESNRCAPGLSAGSTLMLY